MPRYQTQSQLIHFWFYSQTLFFYEQDAFYIFALFRKCKDKTQENKVKYQILAPKFFNAYKIKNRQYLDAFIIISQYHMYIYMFPLLKLVSNEMKVVIYKTFTNCLRFCFLQTRLKRKFQVTIKYFHCTGHLIEL